MRVGYGSMVIVMTHLAVKDENGNYHVDNYVMGRHGQHHVHTPEGFKKWAKGIVKEDLRISDKVAPCKCGLGPGDVREYDGQVWHNDKFV